MHGPVPNQNCGTVKLTERSPELSPPGTPGHREDKSQVERECMVARDG